MPISSAKQKNIHAKLDETHLHPALLQRVVRPGCHDGGWRDERHLAARHRDHFGQHARHVVAVVIEDDGVGAKGRSGNGVRGMAERASAAGATLRIGDGKNGGTAVSVTW